MDRWTDEWTDRPTRACSGGYGEWRAVGGGTVPAGVAGEREHLPAGLRSSHGFCGSGSPPTPAAGREGRQRCQRVGEGDGGWGGSPTVQHIVT